MLRAPPSENRKRLSFQPFGDGKVETRISERKSRCTGQNMQRGTLNAPSMLAKSLQVPQQIDRLRGGFERTGASAPIFSGLAIPGKAYSTSDPVSRVVQLSGTLYFARNDKGKHAEPPPKRSWSERVSAEALRMALHHRGDTST